MKVGQLFLLTCRLRRLRPSPSLKFSLHERTLRGCLHRGEDQRQQAGGRAATLCLAQHLSYMSLFLFSVWDYSGSLLISTPIKPVPVELDTQRDQHPSVPAGSRPWDMFIYSDNLILNQLEKMNTFKLLGLPKSENQELPNAVRIESGEAGLHMCEVSGILAGVSF